MLVVEAAGKEVRITQLHIHLLQIVYVLCHVFDLLGQDGNFGTFVERLGVDDRVRLPYYVLHYVFGGLVEEGDV